MATIILLDDHRETTPQRRAAPAERPESMGAVLLFTGVRYERFPACEDQADANVPLRQAQPG